MEMHDLLMMKLNTPVCNKMIEFDSMRIFVSFGCFISLCHLGEACKIYLSHETYSICQKFGTHLIVNDSKWLSLRGSTAEHGRAIRRPHSNL